MPYKFARFVMASLILLPFAAAGEANAATTACQTVAACIFGTNSGPGVGVEGSGTSGYGLEGLSKMNDGVVGHTAVNPTSAGTGKAGLAGYDDSSNAMPYNSGVYGVSKYSMGVQGRSTNGTGVFALSYKGNAMLASAGSPLFTGFANVGLVAQSATGDGIIGIGPTTGIVGYAAFCSQPGAEVGCNNPLSKQVPSGAAVSAGTDQGGLGLSIYTDTAAPSNERSGVGATIIAGSVGLDITPDTDGIGATGLIVNGTVSAREELNPLSFQGAIISGYNAMSVSAEGIGIAVSGGSVDGAAIVAQAPQDSFGPTLLFQGSTKSGTATSQIDANGNMVLAGTLTQKGTITSQIQNSDGTYSAAYNARSTTPSVEDMGEGTLTYGSAFVPIDPALFKSLNMSRGYLVFLTPQGATTGLYVTGKTASGFSVREIGNARDSLAFDYRIVGHPYAEQGTRLARISPIMASATHQRPLFYRHLKPLRFNHGKLDTTSLPVPSM